MTKKKLIWLSVCVAIFYLVFYTALTAGSLLYDAPLKQKPDGAVRPDKVSAVVYEDTKEVSLPHNFTNLAPRTPVTVTMDLTAKERDYLYIKSVYSPLKVYANDKLIYEYGQDGTYPKFMQDPATAVRLVPLTDGAETIQLRMEFLSPVARDVLTVHPVLVGTQSAIFSVLLSQMGFNFMFAIILLFVGCLLALVAALVMIFEKKGISFLWLGFFAVAVGGWALGECNLTGLFIHNPTLLYLMAFSGMISFAIPLIYFGLTVVDFHDKRPLFITALIDMIAAAAGLLLQLLGMVSLSKSMYVYHILVPLSLCVFAGSMLYEGIRYRNKSAIRFTVPMAVLALFILLEVVNYQARFTNVLTLFFQIGVMIFILLTGLVAGIFVRDALKLRSEKQQLEFEVNLMETQVAEQKKHHQLMLENAAAVKAQRHDLRHQLAVLRSYGEGSNSQQITDYIDTLIEEIPAEQGSFCENTAVNAIVSHYATLAKKSDIELSIKLTVPEHTEQITDSTLCIIFGNLLENGMEACNRMTEGDKFIRLRSRLQYETLTVTMDNSFNGAVSKSGEKFLSSKRNEVGTGLASVTAMAKKHGGNASFESDGLVFQSSVYVRV
ncbi:MAG: GHKL domain-containing protein [Christensenella sp.]